MAEEKLNPGEMNELETGLAALQPRPSRIDRDRLMYLAGQASAAAPVDSARRRWFWPAATAAMSVIAATLAVLVVVRPQPKVVERVVYVTQPAKIAAANGDKDTGRVQTRRTKSNSTDDRTVAERTVERDVVRKEFPPGTYLYQREVALAEGIEALPVPSSGGTSAKLQPVTARELMQELNLRFDDSGRGERL